MKLKRLMAATLSVAMATVPMTVLAASDLPADSTITGSGDVDYVSTAPVYEVTLPTTGALDFTVDPQGLLGLKDDETKTLAELTGKGAITMADAAGAYIKNESSVAVKVSVKMNITDTADTKVTPVSAYDDVEKDTAKNILLLAIPGNAKFAAMSDYKAASDGVAITDITAPTNAQFSFVLSAAEYGFTKSSGTTTYGKITGEDNYDAASFKLGGLVNSKADWSDYVGSTPKTLGVSAVFSVADATDTDKVGETSAYALSSDVTTMEVQGASSAIACKLQTIASGTGTDITTAITSDKGIYIKVGTSFLTTASDKLTSVKLNDQALTIATKGNSSGNNNALYFKLPSGKTLKANDVLTVVVDGQTYTFTVK